MLNKVILQGNMGRNPRIDLTQDGREIATFSLATSTSWRDEFGEWQTCTEWHRIIVFRESTVKWIKGILKKGDSIYVEGKLTYQHWIDTYGQSRLTSYVVVSGNEGRLQYLRSPYSPEQKKASLLKEKDSQGSHSTDLQRPLFDSLEISEQSRSNLRICLPKDEGMTSKDAH